MMRIQLIVWALMFVSALSSTVAESQTSVQTRTDLMAKLSQSSQATVPILIRMTPQSVQMSDTIIAKRAFSAKRHVGVIDQPRRVFKESSMMAMSVDQGELEALLKDPNITLYEDTLKRPSLAESVALVYPTQNTSTFHGNNQWAVAVLDTGVSRSHSFLNSKVVSEACYSNGGGLPSTESLCPGGANSSTASGAGAPCSLTGCEHGTQVAGVAAGNGNAFDGVARDALLLSIQVYSQINDESFCFPDASCIGAFTSDLIAAMERVFELRNSFDIAAVNISLGSDELFPGSCDDQPERPIIDALRDVGIAVVASTGNSGNTSMMQSPACITNAIAVAASADNANTAWPQNNTSDQLDLFAPGVSITSSDSNGGFATGTGTSLAAPHVAGAFAVIKNAAPSLSVAAVENILRSRGPAITQNSVTRRRLNITAALAAVVAPAPAPNPGPVVPRDPSDTPAIPAIISLLLSEQEL